MPEKKQSATTGAVAATASTGGIRIVHAIGEVVRIDAAYRVPDVHPRRPGPWSAETDKLAWMDASTGYACIVRRDARGGHLCGYVAVPPGHPLHGMSAEVLVGLHLAAHNGIGHAEACEDDQPESRSVCHPRPDRPDEAGSEVLHRTGGADGHDDAWWFGFACDGLLDVVPGGTVLPPRTHPLDGIVERVYRDEAFLLEETTRLAPQLKAVEDGRDPVEVVVPRRLDGSGAPRGDLA